MGYTPHYKISHDKVAATVAFGDDGVEITYKDLAKGFLAAGTVCAIVGLALTLTAKNPETVFTTAMAVPIWLSLVCLGASALCSAYNSDAPKVNPLRAVDAGLMTVERAREDSAHNLPGLD